MDRLALGLASPIVTHNVGLNNAWELDAGVDDLVAIAQAADALGYHHVTCSEHFAYPADRVLHPGAGRYWDPLATLSWIGASTTNLRLATHVLVLPYHHPLELAKQYGTLDRMSNGRVVLGVGVGHLRVEFDQLGVPYGDRGARSDDALRALRAALSRREPVYEGTHFRFSDVVVDPCAVQERVPIWVGGSTYRSLRRAVAWGDGWAPYGLEHDELAALLARGRADGLFDGLFDGRPFELVLYAQPRVDPLGAPDAVTAQLRAYEAVGATMLNLRVVHDSRAHAIEQVAAMAELARREGQFLRPSPE